MASANGKMMENSIKHNNNIKNKSKNKNNKTTTTTSKDTDVLLEFKIASNGLWWTVFSIVLILAFTTRLYKISEPDHVCWDETHFGKMGSWYINRTFFFDVHPPLGKMMVGLFGVITGYDGTFPFNKPGDKYEETKYIGMRVCCVIMGTFLVPFAFLTVWEMTKSLPAATLSGCLILFDNGLITLSQYILLDPILLFFLTGSVYSSSKFRSQRNRPFSLVWWFWLSVTGVFLACAISVKFVGLFVVLFVGIQTIVDLWSILGDLSRPVTYTGLHFAARAVCLIILPFILYSSFFYIHLKILDKSGSGDGFFSSAFQSQLRGNSLYNASLPRKVAYGALITLKSQRTGGGYLHSHWHLYPEGTGPRQQQVTTYTHKDDNNKWLIKKYSENYNPDTPVEIVQHGDLIRLEHWPTKRNLHSHKEAAPVTKKHFQVSGYGENGTGDANDVWRVEIVGGKDGDAVQTVTSKLKLVHALAKCALHGHGKQLPKWGYEQMEVSCNPNLRDSNNLWNVEDNYFPKLPNVSVEVYAPSFASRFIESHAVMLQGNSGLKPKEGEVTSKPWQWPINYRGQFFSGNNYKIYLLGNPVIWWGNLLLMAVYFLVVLCILFRWQRGCYEDAAITGAYNKFILERKQNLIEAGSWMILGWILHYVPFWGMGRVLYFHHYFPALIFNSMLSAIILDYLMEIVPEITPLSSIKVTYHWLFGVVLSIIVYSFYLFAPLSYGMDGSSNEQNNSMHGLKWLDSWEF
uniref:Protein O-mannosyl-transferase 2 n=1 Tax=Strigamia maritima TaxID=126957 RepID=T1J5X4_STRMM